MKVIFVFAAVVALAIAAPQGADKDAHVLRLENDNIGVEGFKWGYETSNKIAAEETGSIENAGTDDEAIAVRGQFSYTGDDGVVYTVTYIADKNGFQPQGAHLPKAP